MGWVARTLSTSPNWRGSANESERVSSSATNPRDSIFGISIPLSWCNFWFYSCAGLIAARLVSNQCPRGTMDCSLQQQISESQLLRLRNTRNPSFFLFCVRPAITCHARRRIHLGERRTFLLVSKQRFILCLSFLYVRVGTSRFGISNG
jgi:hypothetical protein